MLTTRPAPELSSRSSSNALSLRRRTPRGDRACRLLWSALVLATGACDGNTDPGGPATLRITTSTSGEDIDPEGYSFSLDGNPLTRIGVNATVTLSGLASGEHLLSVEGIAANCALASGNSQVLTLAGGDTTEAVLVIACQALRLSHPAGTIASVATLDGAPYGVAVSEAGVVYAALIGTSSLIRGDLGTMSSVRRWRSARRRPTSVARPMEAAFATLQTGRHRGRECGHQHAHHDGAARERRLQRPGGADRRPRLRDHRRRHPVRR